MSIALSVYDIFTYAVPGAAYLTLLTFTFTQLNWIQPGRLLDGNTTLLIVGVALACYLTGYIAYPVGWLATRVAPGWRKDMNHSREEFARRVPAARNRPFRQADRSVLQAAIEVHGADAALEVVRLRAISLMLRNIAPALALGAVAALAEAIDGNAPGLAACCFLLLLVVATGSLWQAGRLAQWADMKTLELAFWIPDIDRALSPEANEPMVRPIQPRRTGWWRR